MPGEVNAVLYGVVQECLSDREWQLGRSLTSEREILRKRVPGRGDSRWKSHETCEFLARSRKAK